MPTTKKRLNITLTPDMDKMLKALAKRDRVPQATIAASLLADAIEIEEDAVWARLAEERDQPGVKWVSHAKTWGLRI